MVVSGIWHDFYDSVFMSLPWGVPLNLYSALRLCIKAPAAWLSWLSLILFISSRQLRRVLKDSPSYSDWVMITIIGIMSILPTLKQNSHPHYLAPSVAALAISSAVVLSHLIIQLKEQNKLKKLFGGAIAAALIPYLGGITWGSSVMIREDRIRLDLEQRNEIRQILNLHLPPEKPILCLSPHPARLYYMINRKPLTRYIYSYGAGWLNNHILSEDDLLNLLLDGEVPGAILELKDYKRKKIEEVWNEINANYQSFKLAHSFHPLHKTKTMVGVEESKSGVNLAQENFSSCNFIQGSIYNLPYDKLGDKFDIVIATEVIEHLFYPKELVRAVKKCLKPQGILIITTPYHGYFKNLILALTGKMDYHFTALWDNGHIKFFSVATLTKLLVSEGYTDIKFNFAGRFPWLWKSMICSSTPLL